MSFKDYFSTHSKDYATFRPDYPKALYQYILKHCRSRGLAWDCATGNGQVAVALAPYFDKVVATDASANQIDHAIRNIKVDYMVSTAEYATLKDHSADLITVGQAMHWFKFDPFYEEVRRVGKKGAIIAVWGYGLLSVNKRIDKIIGDFYRDVVGDFWPHERRHIEDRYQKIPFPFKQFPERTFSIDQSWDLDHIMGYLNTWSAVQQYIQKYDEDPIDDIAGDLKDAWGMENERLVRWPVFTKIGVIR